MSATLIVSGCGHPRLAIDPLPPIPMRDAVRIVNDNVGKIAGTLRASGSVDGYFTNPNNGRRVNYSLDGTLFHLAPSYVRFDLKKFGDRQILFGSNEENYWFYSKEDDRFYCGRQGESDNVPAEIPVRSDQIVEALGLTMIGEDAWGGRVIRRVQRVDLDVQQILFVEVGEDGQAVLEKEYWLDRYPPRLVRRVVFRGADGVVTMESFLDDYRPIAAGGPLLPHKMAAEWPEKGARMRFDVGRWSAEEQVVPGGAQFATPAECRSNFDVDRRP